MVKHCNIIVEGKVQGVNFRLAAVEKARECGVYGFVRNKDDGSVYMEVEGEEAAIQALIAWCQDGTDHAHVKKVKVATEDGLKGFKTFGAL